MCRETVFPTGAMGSGIFSAAKQRNQVLMPGLTNSRALEERHKEKKLEARDRGKRSMLLQHRKPFLTAGPAKVIDLEERAGIM